MYKLHFGFNFLPFENTPDPLFYYTAGQRGQVKTRVSHAIDAGMGIVVVTGAIGSGKTTLSQMIISEIANNRSLIWLPEPPVSGVDLLVYIADELGIKVANYENSTFIIRELREKLRQLIKNNRRCIVIIDECHLITDDTIKGLRLLNNLEDGAQKLIQLVLFGQEEFLKIIDRPEMESFKQRIQSGMETLGAMDAESSCKYIKHRLKIAGSHPGIFDDTAWKGIKIALSNDGTPRMINSLCHRALTVAFEKNKKQVDITDIYVAAKVLGIQEKVYFYIVDLNTKLRAQAVERKSHPLNREKTPPQKSIKWPIFFALFSAALFSAALFILVVIYYCDNSNSQGFSACFSALWEELT